MNFETYLMEKRLSAKTIEMYTHSSLHFLNWLKDADVVPELFTYNDLLDYMRYCYGAGITNKRLHAILGVVRHYCSYLISIEKRNDNPASGVFIKGLIRKLPANLLSMEELETLYGQYCLQLKEDVSKKIMLGLMIYQGVTVAELIKLKSHHFRMKDCKVFIKGTQHSNERLLDLHANQVLLLQKYLSSNPFKDGYLFVEPKKTPVSEKNIHNRLQYMFKLLKQLNGRLMSAKQIRHSVITHWLKQHHLRQVQYMAGHKYVSSTQRYQLNNLDDLKTELQQHHPMK
ncbi:MAG: tyrosine-type recombinase/integrase [Sediminibacterium sp.]|nr:tyrosine-type recombinase/integrase [Sediminibacterium sp.]